jgi:hypothetical protein
MTFVLLFTLMLSLYMTPVLLFVLMLSLYMTPVLLFALMLSLYMTPVTLFSHIKTRAHLLTHSRAHTRLLAGCRDEAEYPCRVGIEETTKGCGG